MGYFKIAADLRPSGSSVTKNDYPKDKHFKADTFKSKMIFKLISNIYFSYNTQTRYL